MFFFIIFAGVSIALTLLGFLAGIGADKTSIMFSQIGWDNLLKCIGFDKGTEALVITISTLVILGLFVLTVLLSFLRSECKLNIVKAVIALLLGLFAIYIYGSAPAPIPGWGGLAVLGGGLSAIISFWPANTKGF